MWAEKALGHHVEVNAKENTMTRISTLCILSSTLAVLGLASNGASAVEVKVTTPQISPKMPKVTVPPKTPQPAQTVGPVTGGGGSGKVHDETPMERTIK